jgi:hypothetical protein
MSRKCTGYPIISKLKNPTKQNVDTVPIVTFDRLIVMEWAVSVSTETVSSLLPRLLVRWSVLELRNNFTRIPGITDCFQVDRVRFCFISFWYKSHVFIHASEACSAFSSSRCKCSACSVAQDMVRRDSHVELEGWGFGPSTDFQEVDMAIRSPLMMEMTV